MASLKSIKALLIDLDGCVYRGSKAIPNVSRTLEEFKRIGIKTIFVTNNSTLTPSSYQRKLASMGVKVRRYEILTSGVATAKLLSDRYGRVNVLALAEEGFTSIARRLGHKILPFNAWKKADVVVVGLYRKLTYEKLDLACRAVRSGADFIATNTDPTFPVENNLLPGAGAIVGAIKISTSKEPFVVGKPSRYMIDMAISKLGVEKDTVAIVGDRLETDMKAGWEAGIKKILVLSGVTSEEDLRTKSTKETSPDIVVEDINSLLPLISR